MLAMILAAGRGERMGQLTKETPKPLLRVADSYLIEYAIASLLRAGIKQIVINVSYQGELIKAAIGDGSRYGVKIIYSEEPERLETGGGILQALPWLGRDPFIVISADIITDYPLQKLFSATGKLAHLVMVTNPHYHLAGDFFLYDGELSQEQRLAAAAQHPRLTFANLGLYHPDLFTNCQPGPFRLAELLIPAMAKGQVSGEHYQGIWYNIGTPADLRAINLRAREDSNLRPLASETSTLSS